MNQQIFATIDIPTLHRFAVGFDQILDSLDRTARSSKSVNGNNYPPHNVIQNDNRYIIEVAVAGFDETELSVEASVNELTIVGTKSDTNTKSADVVYLHKGIASRSFRLVFAIAQNMEIIGASVKNGILTVSLEHQVPELPEPKKIAIAFQK